MGLNIHLWIVKYELEQMSKYLELIGGTFSARLKSIEQAYEREMSRSMTDDEWAMLDDRYTDEFFEAGQDLPQILLTSFIIAWYSFVEQQLIKICELLKLRVLVGPTDDTNFGTGIRRARRFLLEAKRYTIDDAHWQELVRIGRLRNTLVHVGKSIRWHYLKPEGRSVAYDLEREDEKVTVYIDIDEDLFKYLEKHCLIEHSGAFFEIRPSFEYARYLVKFGLELFSKLYGDLYPRPGLIRGNSGDNRTNSTM